MKSIKKILIIFVIALTITNIPLPTNTPSTPQVQVADKGGGFGSGNC